MNQPLKDLQKLIKYSFKDENKLIQALIHRSYLNEHKDSSLESNERYEFLGDAVLELWSSDTLFKLFPKFDEGKMTNLRSLIVCTKNLYQISLNIDLGRFIMLSRGEENHGGRENQSILADTLEATIGAIYLDSNIKTIFSILDRLFKDSLDKLSSQKVYKDPKSIFQEIAQAKKGITPHYQTISENGPDHQKVFEVGVFIGEEQIAVGSGNSKQKAEEDASIKATKLFSNLV
ncbi:Ribonuclease 3 [bioreactor metagenome]|uniref:ribonuclease III n=1 Tax=bioreactor metagenome TaxID=1076179 RepID=A0A645AVL7_9ZZZZ